MKRKLLLFGTGFFLFISLVLGFVAVWFVSLPMKSSAELEKIMVKKGDNLNKIAADLEKKGIIRSAFSLKLTAKMQQTPIIHPGTYALSAAMSPKEILHVLDTQPQEVWVTLLEGWRLEEIAEELEENLQGRITKDEFISLAKTQEGKLFPDSYLLATDVTASTILSLLSNTFERRYAQALEGQTAPTLTQSEIITLASLLEREARGEEDMKMVAGILLNRIRIGMPLQVDATLQYAAGYDSKEETWWSVPRSEDKQIDSPFNTYKFVGFPPGPICNPGLLALKAAVAPTKSNNLYYISDTKGKMYYAQDYAQHQQNIERYLK